MASDAQAASERSHRIAMPLADVNVDAVTKSEAVEIIVGEALAGRGGLVVTPNIDHLHQIATGGSLGVVYREADLCLADGMPLVWASRLLRDPLPERVAGSDLLGDVCEAAAADGLSVYFLGGGPGAADALAELYVTQWPDLVVAGTACPPFGFEHEKGAVEAICATIVEARPSIVFTALGAPKQDLLNLEIRSHLPTAWYLGVGAAFEMATGCVDRAPAWVQRIGAEWVFRLLQEPRRMASRYLVRDAPFALRLLAASWREGRARP